MSGETNHIQSKFISDRFDVQDISNLSLFLYESLLTVIAHRQSDQSVIAANIYSLHEEEALEKIVGSDELINASNTSGRLYLHHQRFTLVPGILFNPAHSALYLNFATRVNPEKDEVIYSGISNNSIQVLGAADKGLLNILDSRLPEMETSHGAAHVLDYFLHNNKDLLKQEIFIHTAPNSMYIAGFKDGELMVFNRFIVHEEQTLLRYLFIVLQQLAFDQAHCKISVFGNLDWVHSSLENLQGFFKNIQQSSPTQNITYQKGTENLKNTQLLEAYWLQQHSIR
ncbi:DUF3822 family protein [Cyclobacterium plantarum]|uniref:DUF3822 family protein n=1 Tax=Cyclobacterium plantarum TaxID=2716263 RepID=A0ABX0H4D3_9BACT|nr:DUF3822 family protein [Cyclobacterium plantarum]NHE55406.1 DUF3822 family protein [Cyclobacterium plantarum]